MSAYWMTWLKLWCGLVMGFGLLIMTTAFAATDGLAVSLIDLLNGSDPIVMTEPLRFAFALMGVVSLGWGMTLLVTFRAVHLLGPQGRPVWRAITAVVVAWYLIDSSLSVATGFALNAASNTLLLVLYLVPMLRTGVVGGRAAVSARA